MLSFLQSFSILSGFFLSKLCSKCSIEAQKTLNLLQKEICQILQYITGFRKQLTCEPGLVNHFIHNVFSLLIQIIDAMFEVPEVHRSICNFIDIVNYFRKKYFSVLTIDKICSLCFHKDFKLMHGRLGLGFP